MTSPRRFEQDLPALLDDLYVAGTPDYRDDLFRATARTRQRPAWSFLTRWLPMDLTMRRLPTVPAPWQVIGAALLIALLLATTLLLVVGSQHRVPPPFGPAGNGLILGSSSGDIFVRDTATGESRLLIGGADGDSEPGASPDGMLIGFTRTVGNDQYLTVADIDGTHVRRVLDSPLVAAWAQWAPDSRHIGVITHANGDNHFHLVSTEGGPETVADIGDLIPYEFQFRPPDGHEIAVRAFDRGQTDVYLMNLDGTNVRKLGLHSNGASGSDRDLSGLSWSPSGDRLGFNAIVHDGPSGVDHLRLRVLTIATMRHVEFPAPSDSSINQAFPSWSPDGTQILVQRFTEEKGWLGLLPADGSSAGRDIGPAIAFDTDGGLDQGWSPDGRTIILRFNDDHFYEIDVASGQSTPLTWPLDRIPDIQRVAP
jgi:hypothetical protein